MKKLIILIAAILIAGSTASAQKKGDMYIGGGLEFGVGSQTTMVLKDTKLRVSTDMSSINASFSPTFSYFILDNFRVGGSLILFCDYSEHEDIYHFFIGPEASYYVRLADNFYYTPEIGFYAGYGAVDLDFSCYNTGIFVTDINAAQFEFRPTRKLGFEVNIAGLEYRIMPGKVSDPDYDNSVIINQFSLNIGASVALKYYF